MKRRTSAMLVLVIQVVGGCAKHVPEPVGVAPGTPHVSWVIMHGDRDNPDQEFACQSDPRNECVVPASRPDAQVFSDVHVYYHGAGGETKYVGVVDIGYFQGASQSRRSPSTITVKKNESITNQSVTGIVSSTPGTYTVAFDLEATVTETGRRQPIRESIQVAVK